MGYLHKDNGYQPTGELNSEPAQGCGRTVNECRVCEGVECPPLETAELAPVDPVPYRVLNAEE